jgi:hypothetical protein
MANLNRRAALLGALASSAALSVPVGASLAAVSAPPACLPPADDDGTAVAALALLEARMRDQGWTGFSWSLNIECPNMRFVMLDQEGRSVLRDAPPLPRDSRAIVERHLGAMRRAMMISGEDGGAHGMTFLARIHNRRLVAEYRNGGDLAVSWWRYDQLAG